MYVIQIRHKDDTAWRTYYKYHKYYISALFAYIKARFDFLFISNVELRIYKIESNEIV